jgi:thiol-disulfide isomerase/thioredoxin
VLAVSAGAGWLLSRRDDVGVGRSDAVPAGLSGGGHDHGRRELPDATIEDESGASQPLAALIGQPLVVNLWYASCVPCRTELPEFAAADATRDDVMFVGLNLDDSVERATRFAGDLGVRYPQFFDLDREVPGALELVNFPTTILVSSDGSIAHVHQGALDIEGLNRIIDETFFGVLGTEGRG